MTKIYIIDDDPDVVKVLQLHLKNAGFETDSFSSGTSALEAMKKSPPNAAIIDVSLPDLSGIELVKITESIDELKEMPVVFLSGRNNIELSSVSNRPKIASFMKPCDFDLLIKKLKEFCG